LKRFGPAAVPIEGLFGPLDCAQSVDFKVNCLFVSPG
jgi:hypothetical protein